MEQQFGANPTHFIMNIILHIIILFTFLSGFFFFFISNAEESAFKEEIGNLIENNIKRIVDDNDSVKDYVREINPVLKSLSGIYNHPDRFSTERNILVKFSSVFVILLLIGVFLTIFVTIKFACDFDLSIKDLVIENIIIFIFVGIIEYLFFTRIAIKYVPAPPSLLINTVINALVGRI